MRNDEGGPNAASPTTTDPAPRTTRRKLLGGAALVTGAVVADAAARAVPARAADGDPVTLGQLNTETHPTVIVNQHQGLLEDNTGLEVTAGGPVGIGVIATGSASGVQGLGSGANGDGVQGSTQGGSGVLGQSTTGVGVFGDSTGGGVGVYGTIENGGIGVRAEGGGLGPGTALEVLGVATFSRSGLATVPAGSNQVTVTGVSDQRATREHDPRVRPTREWTGKARRKDLGDLRVPRSRRQPVHDLPQHEGARQHPGCLVRTRLEHVRPSSG